MKNLPTITLFDYADNRKEFTPSKPFKTIRIEVISGDEIAFVTYDDNTVEIFDSSDCRIMDYFDYEYILYDEERDINIYDFWVTRRNSYDMEGWAI